MSNKHLFKINYDEAKAISMGLAMMIDTIKKCAGNPKYPWNPEARQVHREMLEAAQSAGRKLEQLTGLKTELPPYFDGDENEFFTKPS